MKNPNYIGQCKQNIEDMLGELWSDKPKIAHIIHNITQDADIFNRTKYKKVFELYYEYSRCGDVNKYQEARDIVRGVHNDYCGQFAKSKYSKSYIEGWAENDCLLDLYANKKDHVYHGLMQYCRLVSQHEESIIQNNPLTRNIYRHKLGYANRWTPEPIIFTIERMMNSFSYWNGSFVLQQ